MNKKTNSRVMKKSGFVFAITGALFVVLTSCNKPEPTLVEKSFTVNLNENQEYSFKLPESMRHDAYSFTTQASHYNISMIDQNSTEQIYHYLPELDYQGTDQVILTDLREKDEQPECGFGICDGNGPGGPRPQDDHHRITINFVVGAANAGTETASR
jgi:hypothetical protein